MFWTIIRSLPPSVRNALRTLLAPAQLVRLAMSYMFDLLRYARYSSTVHTSCRQHEEAYLIMTYHKIEKALALKRPRPGFGKDSVKAMLRRLARYFRRYGVDDTVEICLSVLESYFNFNKGYDEEIDRLESQYSELRDVILGNSSVRERNRGGVVPLTREEVLQAASVDFESFSRMRRSIRNFAPEPVELEILERALSIAQSTPSVCNRQTWRTHIFLNKEQIKKILKYQNGNRGFGEDAGAILIITASLRYFRGVGERNQAFIDGGMYAMNLVYALHSLGLGTCCLNLSLNPGIDVRLHKAANIPSHEVPIMMIAVGHLPATFSVAASRRKPIDEVVVVH